MSAFPPCYGVIPARYGSSRFPGKPLAEIAGKCMFQHVYERARMCPELVRVVLATDDPRILAKAGETGVEALMTSPDHASGTDRVFEAARLMQVPAEAVVVNIQGDEPLLDPAMVSALVAPFADDSVRVTTLAHPIDATRAASGDQVKTVFTKGGRALYFSRSVIPHTAKGTGETYFGHIGMYAFRMEALERFTSLARSELERREKLEQLRLLENGIDIHVVVTQHACRGVDRPEDIEHVTKMLKEKE